MFTLIDLSSKQCIISVRVIPLPLNSHSWVSQLCKNAKQPCALMTWIEKYLPQNSAFSPLCDAILDSYGNFINKHFFFCCKNWLNKGKHEVYKHTAAYSVCFFVPKMCSIWHTLIKNMELQLLCFPSIIYPQWAIINLFKSILSRL